MNAWLGKVAVVTGASGGIGLAISKALASYGIRVIGLARRMEKLTEASAMIGQYLFHPIECDIKVEDEILNTFKYIEEHFGGVDILVNNAGIFNRSYIIDSDTTEFQDVINTNLMAPAILAREAMNSIKKRNARGHIINISGTPGLYLQAVTVPIGMYGPSKYGLKALGIELRHEIALAELNIKLTTISPGFVQSDMLKDLYEFLNLSEDGFLKDTDIADTVIYVLGTPESVEIAEITVLVQGKGSNAIVG
ncbi:farnesol dehydrogenase-like [Bombus pascuorum]|uniref:farnesol dehydrogenase-like n=1 Tax=Bombus pascuorum TaxID=65598 RepID=UPI00298D8EE5|nr:farnesol dehydrogenase-like [Bombus pascuorum]